MSSQGRLGQLVWLWAIGGVVAILLQAVIRLGPRALGVFEEGLTPLQWGITGVWVLFMLYSEAWRGFHLNFSPRVVARASGLMDRPAPLLWLFAPIVAMGLVYATPRRLLVSRLLLGGIVALILLVRQLPEPWRAMVDLGVVLGLAAGTVSVLWFAVRAMLGTGPGVDPQFPDGHAPEGSW